MNIKYVLLTGLMGLIACTPMHGAVTDVTAASAATINTLFNKQSANTQASFIELHNCSPEALLISPDALKNALEQLAKTLKLETIRQPLIAYAKTGYTFALLGEQGSITGNFFNAQKSAQVTIHQNQPYNTAVVAQLLVNLFKGTADVHAYVRS